jgi:phytoene synthase
MSRDTSFYYSFLVLPPRKRAAIIAVWDFCRAVDDAVDEVVPEEEWKGGLSPDARARAERQIEEWRTELNAVYSGTPRTRQGIGLQPHTREFNLPRAPFDELINGVEMDLRHDRYQTFEALAEYCRRVASMVGLICVEIFGYRDAATRDYAVDLGMALQLTNIIRDVATDLRRGRVYLPTVDLVRFGVTDADLARGTVTPAVRELLRFQCERARDYYRRAAAELPAVDRGNLLAAEIMGAIYFEILQRIERAGYDVFSQRIRVPRPYRALLALRLWLTTLLGVAPPRTRAAPLAHDSQAAGRDGGPGRAQ